MEKDKKVDNFNNALNIYNKIILKQKKVKYYIGLYNIYTILQEYILDKLDELEEAGITHPDVEKVRALLEK